MEYTYAQRLAALEANERVASRTMHATFNEIESRLAALEQRMEEMLSQAEEARQERALADAEDDTLLTVDMMAVYDMIARRNGGA